MKEEVGRMSLGDFAKNVASETAKAALNAIKPPKPEPTSSSSNNTASGDRSAIDSYKTSGGGSINITGDNNTGK